MPDTDRERIAARWGDTEFTAQLTDIHWMGSQVVRDYLNRLASGDSRLDWLTALAARHLRGTGLRCLVLGCGEGWLERQLAAHPAVREIEALDIAPAAVEAAAAAAERQGLRQIRYAVHDLNRDPLPSAAFDAIVAHSVLHHVEKLEFACAELAKTLRPGGVLLVNEYVGPRRFQYSEHQMALINRLLPCLPESLRLRAGFGLPFPRKERPDESYLATLDPSEAVRSDELEGALAGQFEIRERLPCGGTLLHHLLYEIVQNFDDRNPHDRSLLALLCWIEETLIRARKIPSDFVLLVGEKRSASQPRTVGSDSAHAHTVAPGPLASPSPPTSRTVTLARVARAALGKVAALGVPQADLTARWGTDLAPIREHLHWLTTGDPTCDWVSWVLHHEFAGSGKTVLVLRDPAGWLVPALLARPTLARVVLATEWTQFPPATYDLVFSNGALACAPDPEALLFAIRATLKPGGALLADEFVGPPGSLPPPQVERYVRELEALLPDHFTARPGDLLPRLRWLRHRLFPDLALQARRSPEILALLARHFAEVRTWPTGGTLLQRLLRPPRPPFNSADAKELALLRLLAEIETILIDEGLLASDYACALARKPPP